MAAPREHGADGRLLCRPWRMRAAAAVDAARRARAARPQPVWPKLLGWAFIAIAVVAATNPVGPVPRHVRLSAGRGPVPEPTAPAALAPSGALAGADALASLSWSPGATRPPFTVVLLDAAYHELARVDGIDETTFAPPSAWRELVQAPGTFHWFVLADGPCGFVRSALATVELR